MDKKTLAILTTFILCLLVAADHAVMAAHNARLATPVQRLFWQRIDIPDPPSPRILFSLALDSTNNQAVLFGGFDVSTGNTNLFNDLWLTNGTTWSQLNSYPNPLERSGAGMVYDEAGQELVLFGGLHDTEYLGSTWKYVPYEWSQQFLQTSPPPRSSACMAYDAARNKTVLFGGGYFVEPDFIALNDTWTWDGANWQQQSPSASPDPKFGANMVYDRARQNIVLFGGAAGGGLHDDTWTWDGTTWTKQHPAHSPPPRADFGMVYDDKRELVILFGGQDNSGVATDTWSWDGQDWTQMETFMAPPLEIAYPAQLVYLPDIQATALIGDLRRKDCPGEVCTVSEEIQVWALIERYLSYLPIVAR